MEYRNYFNNTKMPRDFHKFAEKAIEMAGKAGERKRQFKRESAGALAKSRMAEVERRQTGESRRRAMMETGRIQRAGMGLTAGASKRKGLSGAGAPSSTRMKSFDYANTSMTKMFPNRINPNTNELFTAGEWEKGVIELANSREKYGGIQPTVEQPAGGGLSGRGRVMRDTGEVYDITPGVEGFQKKTATPEMMESAGFASKEGGGFEDSGYARSRRALADPDRYYGEMPATEVAAPTSPFASRESLYDTGITSQNVGRRGLQTAGSGLATIGGWVKDKWGRWVKRPTNVDLGSLGIFGK